MKRLSLLLIMLLMLSACEGTLQEASAMMKNTSNDKVWTYMQFNIPEEGDKIESYYYYALISKPLYEAISKNELQKGFIYLEDVKYWGNDDLIYDYADGEYEGDLVFRIEDIRTIRRMTKRPKAGIGAEQFDEKPQKSKVVPNISPSADPKKEKA